MIIRLLGEIHLLAYHQLARGHFDEFVAVFVFDNPDVAGSAVRSTHWLKLEGLTVLVGYLTPAGEFAEVAWS